MYHQHSHQQGSQPFSNGSRPPLHQQPPNQHQNCSNMPVMGFQFPRPTQLPDELESALAIRGGRDMDHRQMDHMNRPNQHQNRGSDSGITQHGMYGPNPVPMPADNQPGQQQGVDWTSYQPPTKLFASSLSNASHQTQQHQGPQQRPQIGQTGARVPNWTPSVNDPPHAASGDGQGLYTPESAGSILASFGLSNEDLEVLSHYPDDQLTPDTLPFILRDIQINKSGNQKTMASTSSFSRNIHDMPLASSGSSPRRSPEVPSLLTVTQTAGKVIDYGHASRAKDESSAKETFKREQLSSERKVEMYPASTPSSSAPKGLKMERRQVCLKQAEPSKHGDRDYRRTSAEQRRSRSPARGFPPSPKSRNLDRDYRREGTKPRPSSESKSEASSRRSLSSSSISKPHGSSKKVPPPTMISDFSAVSPKVYPHTCSLCHTQCDQDKVSVDMPSHQCPTVWVLETQHFVQPPLVKANVILMPFKKHFADLRSDSPTHRFWVMNSNVGILQSGLLKHRVRYLYDILWLLCMAIVISAENDTLFYGLVFCPWTRSLFNMERWRNPH